jgi:hypothetical protein
LESDCLCDLLDLPLGSAQKVERFVATDFILQGLERCAFLVELPVESAH